MQSFYDNLTAAADERDANMNWLARIRKASLDQIGVLQESALAWSTWD